MIEFFRKIPQLFASKIPKQKIGVFGMMNNPHYRQEPWKESIASRLAVFDVVYLVCGNEGDISLLKESFTEEWESGRLVAVYKPWPFPEWSYEELPKHLNSAFLLAKNDKCDWMIKLDIDTLFHEKDFKKIRKDLYRAFKKKRWIVTFRKLQFFNPNKYWQKGKMPIAISSYAPLVYGFDTTRYTDLCQPIVWDGQTMVDIKGKVYDIPSGKSVDTKHISHSKICVYNYDFTFRTKERSIELLYQIEMAHARFWGKGYSGISLEHITRESSYDDFVNISKERYLHMKRKMDIGSHPQMIQKSLHNLSDEQFGKKLWGII